MSHIANFITFLRLAFVPVIVWALLNDAPSLAFALFLAAGISDAIDGPLARLDKNRGPLGAILDPVADKALIVSVFVALGIIGALPIWLIALVAGRDVMILGGSWWLQTRGYALQIRPLLISKLNTFLQISLAAFILAVLGVGMPDFGLTPLLVFAAAATTCLSMLAYWQQGTGYLKQPPEQAGASAGHAALPLPRRRATERSWR